MNEEVTKEVAKKVDKEVVEQAIEFILEEGKELGYQEAMKIYGKQYRDIIRRGRKQGIAIAIVLGISGAIAYTLGKKKIEEKLNDLKAKKEPINVDPVETEEVEEVKEE